MVTLPGLASPIGPIKIILPFQVRIIDKNASAVKNKNYLVEYLKISIFNDRENVV